MALEEAALREAERRKQQFDNEFDEDMITSEEDLKLDKDKVRLSSIITSLILAS